ncbi:MAG: YigZ family protein [Oscillospiraceae bacterium]|nr:YigZ family protein [Oscillospiraceae bacterium]
MMGYRTVKKESVAELVEKKSRFIARVCPVSTEQEALDFLASVRAENRTASHNVFAYRLRERNLSRYSDDGEPSGTAGLPVLDILDRGEITDTVIVVTRYFGGTLLGTGGLVRAYSSAARMGVKEAGVVLMEIAGSYRFSCGYSDYDKAVRIIRDAQADMIGSEFMDEVTISYTADDQKADKIEKALVEMTRGKGRPELIEKGFFPVEI